MAFGLSFGARLAQTFFLKHHGSPRQKQITATGWLELLGRAPRIPMGYPQFLRGWLTLTSTLLRLDPNLNLRSYTIICYPAWVLRPTQGHAYNETPSGIPTCDTINFYERRKAINTKNKRFYHYRVTRPLHEWKLMWCDTVFYRAYMYAVMALV